MKPNRTSRLSCALAAAAAGLALTASAGHAADVTLLNVSYDPTRELYQDYNAAFTKYWKEKTGDTVTVSSCARKPPTRRRCAPPRTSIATTKQVSRAADPSRRRSPRTAPS